MKRKSFHIIFATAVLLALAAALAYMLPNLMLYPFEFSVGMDSIFNQDFLFKVVGYVLGLLLMLLLGVSVYKVAAKLPTAVLIPAIAICLLVVILQQAVEVAQISIGRNFIPRYSWMVALVIFVLDHANWFIYGLSFIAALLAIALLLQIKLGRLPVGNPAQLRKAKASQRRQKKYCLLLIITLVLCILLVTVGRYYDSRGIELSPPIELPVLDGKIIIPLASINDGHLHRYVYNTDDGVAIRYIVIKKSESGYGVGLDACDICGPTGYYERNGKEVVCILCDVVMNISTIGFPGGCNPVPLKFTISDGNLIIETKNLDSEKRRFE